MYLFIVFPILLVSLPCVAKPFLVILLKENHFFFHLGSMVRLVTFEMCIQVIRLLTIDGKDKRIKDEHLAMLQVRFDFARFS